MSNKTVTVVNKNPFFGFLYFLVCVGTAIIGYRIHGSLFWSIVDFFFSPLAWLKWMICHEVNVSIIKDAFEFFLQ